MGLDIHRTTGLAALSRRRLASQDGESSKACKLNRYSLLTHILLSPVQFDLRFRCQLCCPRKWHRAATPPACHSQTQRQQNSIAPVSTGSVRSNRLCRVTLIDWVLASVSSLQLDGRAKRQSCTKKRRKSHLNLALVSRSSSRHQSCPLTELHVAYEVSLSPDAPLAIAPPATPSHGAVPLAAALATEIAQLFQLGSHAAAPTTGAREIPYARRVRTVWHLLNEDASQQGQPAAIDGWSPAALDAALQRHVGPLASALAQAHSIARESSSQWWSPLAFEPRQVRLAAPMTAAALSSPLVAQEAASTLDNVVPSETRSADDALHESEEQQQQQQEVQSALEEQAQSDTAPAEPEATLEPAPEPVAPSLKEYHITQEDLQIFVNGAEWSMASPSPAGQSDFPSAPWPVHSGPQGASRTAWGQEALDTERTLHFCLFIPSPAHRPMRIQDEPNSQSETGTSQATGWLVPQWGGVVIYNPPHSNQTLAPPLDAEELDAPMRLFASQLRALLGLRLPVAPPGSTPAQRAARRSVALDALLRRRLLETSRETVDTLTGIIRLVDKIQNLGVGKQVRDDVIDALDNLESVSVSVLARKEMSTNLCFV